MLLQGLLRQTNPDFITLLLLGFESQQRDTPNYISNAVRSILHALTSASSQRLGSMHAQAAASSAIKVNIYVLGLVGDTRFVTAALFACCPIRAVVCQLNYFGCGCQEVLAQRHHNLDLAFTRALKMWESGPAQNSPAAKKQKSSAKQRSNSASATTTAQVEVADKTRLYDAQQSHVALASRIEQQSCGRVQFESGQRVSLTDRSK